MKSFLILITLLIFSSTSVAAKDKNRKLYQYRWYTIEAIREYVSANHPEDIGWVFPAGRKYILDGEGDHSPDLTMLDIKPEKYRSGKLDGFTYRPEAPVDVSQKIEKMCTSLLKERLMWIGDRSGFFSHFKTPRYEVVGIKSNILVEAPYNIYYSKKRPIVTKKPDKPRSLLCSVYMTPKRGGKVSYQAVVVLTAKAVYGKIEQ